MFASVKLKITSITTAFIVKYHLHWYWSAFDLYITFELYNIFKRAVKAFDSIFTKSIYNRRPPPPHTRKMSLVKKIAQINLFYYLFAGLIGDLHLLLAYLDPLLSVLFSLLLSASFFVVHFSPKKWSYHWAIKKLNLNRVYRSYE